MRNCRSYFEKKVKEIASSGAMEANKQLVLRYIRHKQSQGLTYSRLAKIVLFLDQFLKWAKFEIPAIRQSDVEEYTIVINNRKWMDWTKVTEIKLLKALLYWLKDEYDIKARPEKLKAVSPKSSMMPEYLISEDEFGRLMNAAEDRQTRLLLGLLYESGARISELLNLKLQNVNFNTNGARLYLRGKTGQRVVPIVWFAGLLREFIAAHPVVGNQEALLFYSRKKGEVRPLNYDVVRMRIKRLSSRAGITKRINPHLFRHTRMTELAREGIGEQTLKAFAGWAGDSKMAATYVHLASKDVEDSLLTKIYGIKIENGEAKEKLRICPKCSEINLFFAKLCQRCKTPLDEKEVQENLFSTSKERTWMKYN